MGLGWMDGPLLREHCSQVKMANGAALQVDECEHYAYLIPHTS